MEGGKKLNRKTKKELAVAERTHHRKEQPFSDAQVELRVYSTLQKGGGSREEDIAGSRDHYYAVINGRWADLDDKILEQRGEWPYPHRS